MRRQALSLILYIFVCAYLFAWVDWQAVHQTRWQHPEWKDRMKTHEKMYAAITRPLEIALCAPAMTLKPIFFEMYMRVQASQEEQDALTHAPRMNWKGFYQLRDRRYSWTFTPWWAWCLYWTFPSLGWFAVVRAAASAASSLLITS